MRTVNNMRGIISNDGGIQETITSSGGMYRDHPMCTLRLVQKADFNSVGPMEFVLRRVRWPSCRDELLLFLLRSFFWSSSALIIFPEIGFSDAVVCLIEG